MAHARIVVSGASAGGFEAVRAVLACLPAVFDRHLTVVDGRVRVARGPREHGFRPAIDPLFMTTARAVGPHAAGVILSGALSDGTLGLQAIEHAGGLAVVQHPITSPSCGGTIGEVEEEGLAHYECHVGHRFDAESLVALTDERTEDTLWKAVRALQEQALLLRRMVDRAKQRGLANLATTWRDEADEAEARGEEIRRLIEGVVSAPAARRESRPRTSEKPRANGKLRRVSRRRK